MSLVVSSAGVDLSDSEVLYVFADLHGQVDALQVFLERFARERAVHPHLLVAGDLGVGYSELAGSLLRAQRNRITAVRGNCDSSRDEELCGFPLPLVRNCFWRGRKILITHGHMLSEWRLPLLPEGSIMITGHSHYPRLERDEETGIILLNPGSVASPRRGSKASFAVIRPGRIEIRNLARGSVMKVLRIEDLAT